MDSACLAKSTDERLLDAAILDQIVEARAALAVLQAVDHGIAAIVADDHDHLVAGENGRIDIRIHHHVGAVADHDDRRAGRVGHGRAPSGRDLIAHAGEAELAVERIGLFDAPVLHHFAGQPAGGGDEIVALASLRTDDTDHLRIGRNRFVGRLLIAIERRIPFGKLGFAVRCPFGV